MNAIINEILAAYLDSKLAVKPHRLTDEESRELEAVEKRFAATKEDLYFFENYLFKYGCMNEQRGFYAGFRTAFDLLAEVDGLYGILE